MLTAYQIEALRVKSEHLIDPVVEFLIEDIANRVSEAGQLTATASYQIWRAQKLGISQRKLKKEIVKRLKVSMKEVETLLTQAAETGYSYDIDRFPNTHAIPLSANSSLQQILEATVNQALEDLSNITQTMGFVGYDGKCRELTEAYRNACDFAFQKVTTGAQDYMSAIRDATKNLAKKGIQFIDYDSGVHTSVEAAVRRNIMGGLGIMQEHISQKNHDDLGCDGWELSAHAGSAPDHEPYQGKQYTDEEYTRLNNSLVRRIGTLNCGHAAFPIILGVNSPQYTPEELEKFRKDNEAGVDFEGRHYTVYEATQRQRAFERSIRAKKREILVDETLGDKEKLQQDRIKLVVLQQEYKRFSDGVGLPVQYSRLEKAGFDWKKAKDADSAWKKEKQHQKNLQIIADDAKIKAASGLPKKLENLPNEKLKHTVNVDIEPIAKGGFQFHAVAPKESELSKMEIQAGYGTSTPIRDLRRLYATYGGQPEKWQKKSGTAYGKEYHYVIHWYENDGFVPVEEIKLKGMKKNK